MIGVQGQVSRLEITTAGVDYEGSPALLVTGVEIIPTQTVPALRIQPEPPAARTDKAPGADPGLLALGSLAEAIITTDAQGRISYLNPAAERMTGSTAEQAA